MATKRSEAFEREIRILMEACESDTLSSRERLRIAEILLKNTTDNTCMVKAGLDEPIFVLRAKDPIADSVVADWADSAHAVHEEEKRNEAYDIASAMYQWRQAHPPKPLQEHPEEEVK